MTTIKGTERYTDNNGTEVVKEIEVFVIESAEDQERLFDSVERSSAVAEPNDASKNDPEIQATRSTTTL